MLSVEMMHIVASVRASPTRRYKWKKYIIYLPSQNEILPFQKITHSKGKGI